jgi:hypothetical protein
MNTEIRVKQVGAHVLPTSPQVTSTSETALLYTNNEGVFPVKLMAKTCFLQFSEVEYEFSYGGGDSCLTGFMDFLATQHHLIRWQSQAKSLLDRYS